MYMNSYPHHQQNFPKKRHHRTNRKEGSLKIAHINFWSINVPFSVQINKLNIILVTETWFTPDIYDAEYFPPELGYTVSRRNSVNEKGLV